MDEKIFGKILNPGREALKYLKKLRRTLKTVLNMPLRKSSQKTMRTRWV